MEQLLEGSVWQDPRRAIRHTAVIPIAGDLVTSDIEVTVVGAEKPSLLYSMQLMYTAPRG